MTRRLIEGFEAMNMQKCSFTQPTAGIAILAKGGLPPTLQDIQHGNYCLSIQSMSVSIDWDMARILSRYNMDPPLPVFIKFRFMYNTTADTVSTFLRLDTDAPRPYPYASVRIRYSTGIVSLEFDNKTLAGTVACQPNVWNVVAFWFLLSSGGTGTTDVWINGVQDAALSATGVALAGAHLLAIRAMNQYAGSHHYYDDLVIDDTDCHGEADSGITSYSRLAADIAEWNAEPAGTPPASILSRKGFTELDSSFLYSNVLEKTERCTLKKDPPILEAFTEVFGVQTHWRIGGAGEPVPSRLDETIRLASGEERTTMLIDEAPIGNRFLAHGTCHPTNPAGAAWNWADVPNLKVAVKTG